MTMKSRDTFRMRQLVEGSLNRYNFTRNKIIASKKKNSRKLSFRSDKPEDAATCKKITFKSLTHIGRIVTEG